MSEENNTAILRACKAVGSQKRLAAIVGVSEQAVSGWIKKQVPADRCIAIQDATHGVVTCYELRPDIFPKPEQAA